jgi:hypothetical protein
MGTGVLLLEGGSASGEVDSTLQALRRAIAMDTLINWLTVPGTQVVLASGNRQLLQAAEKLGAGLYDLVVFNNGIKQDVIAGRQVDIVSRIATQHVLDF